MAVVRYGPLVQSVRGALGAVVFARQGGTAIVRTRPLKVNQQTARQLGTRAKYGRVVAKWRSLTDEQRLMWFRCAQTYRHAGPEGVSRPLSAWLVFAMVNLRMLDAGGIMVEEPSPYNEVVESVGVRLDVWPGGPVNLVHSMVVGSSGSYYRLLAQPTFRVWATLPGRTLRRTFHRQSLVHCDDVTSGFEETVGLPGVNEFVRWDCLSHLAEWPSGARFTGLSQVPNVSGELVTNATMELHFLNAWPDGWHVAGAGSIDSSHVQTWGGYSTLLWTRAASAGSSAVYTDFNMDLSVAGSYVLRFAARCVSGTPWNEVFVATTSVVLAYITTPAIPADGLWHEYVCPFTVVTGYPGCKLQLSNYNASDMATHLDDVSIRRNL